MIAAVTFNFSPASFALDGVGTIEEVRLCSYPNSNWKNMLFFRLSDGNWFGVYGHFRASSSAAYGGDSPGQSLVLLAYANNHTVNVRATYATFTQCGVTANMLFDKAGDYVAVSKN